MNLNLNATLNDDVDKTEDKDGVGAYDGRPDPDISSLASRRRNAMATKRR